MIGGYNVGPLVDFLEVPALAAAAAEALKGTILVYGAFDRVAELAEDQRRGRGRVEILGRRRVVPPAARDSRNP